MLESEAEANADYDQVAQRPRDFGVELFDVSELIDSLARKASLDRADGSVKTKL